MAYEVEAKGPDEYKKRQEAIKRKLSSAAKSSGSKILKNQADTEKRRDNPEIRDNCEMVHMLFHEGIEMYKSGDMTFKGFIEDLNKSLMAIAGEKKDNPKDEDDES